MLFLPIHFPLEFSTCVSAYFLHFPSMARYRCVPAHVLQATQFTYIQSWKIQIYILTASFTLSLSFPKSCCFLLSLCQLPCCFSLCPGTMRSNIGTHTASFCFPSDKQLSPSLVGRHLVVSPVAFTILLLAWLSPISQQPKQRQFGEWWY